MIVRLSGATRVLMSCIRSALLCLVLVCLLTITTKQQHSISMKKNNNKNNYGE